MDEEQLIACAKLVSIKTKRVNAEVLHQDAKNQLQVCTDIIDDLVKLIEKYKHITANTNT